MFERNKQKRLLLELAALLDKEEKIIDDCKCKISNQEIASLKENHEQQKAIFKALNVYKYLETQGKLTKKQLSFFDNLSYIIEEIRNNESKKKDLKNLPSNLDELIILSRDIENKIVSGEVRRILPPKENFDFDQEIKQKIKFPDEVEAPKNAARIFTDVTTKTKEMKYENKLNYGVNALRKVKSIIEEKYKIDADQFFEKALQSNLDKLRYLVTDFLESGLEQKPSLNACVIAANISQNVDGSAIKLADILVEQFPNIFKELTIPATKTLDIKEPKNPMEERWHTTISGSSPLSEDFKDPRTWQEKVAQTTEKNRTNSIERSSSNSEDMLRSESPEDKAVKSSPQLPRKDLVELPAKNDERELLDLDKILNPEKQTNRERLTNSPKQRAFSGRT